MLKKIQKKRLFKLIGVIFLIIFLIYFLLNSTNLIGKNTDTFLVEEGTLSYEEEAEGYIIRDENVLKGTNSSNGVSQIVSEGSRVSKGESVFRYYLGNEEEINSQIDELDNQIDEALQNNQEQKDSVDIISLETEMKNILNELYKSNSIQDIKEYKKNLSSYATKKAEIAGELSPAGSYIKELIEKRKSLSDQLNSNSETIVSDRAGMVSYRVDGLEDVLTINNGDFSYLSSDLLDSFGLNVGVSIPESQESGKIINNYYCYIACPIDTENSEVASVGDEVMLRLSDGSEVPAEISYIVQEDKDRILVFKITEGVERLIEYRKISFEIVWWSYSGWKISNSAIVEENDLSYVYVSKAGVQEKVLVKVLRQNDTYSIVENYTNDELMELGYSVDEIQNMPQIKLYDQIIVKNK